MTETSPRDNRGRFLKGCHYSLKTEFKKGHHPNKETEIKKGCHLSRKTEFKKGEKHHWDNWNRGLTKETDERVKKHSEMLKGIKRDKTFIENCRLRMLGNKLSKETKEKIGKANKGRKLKPSTPEQLELRRLSMKNWWNDNKNKEKIKMRNEKISKKLSGIKRSEECKENNRLRNLGKKLSPETRRKISEGNKGKKKPPKTEEQKRNISIKLKRMWDNKNYREKQLKAIFKGFDIRPTKPEKIVLHLIEKNNLPFHYIGNGKLWIGGKFNPDFISNDQKYIIEIFGDYWHNLPNAKKNDEERLKTYIKCGYITLVIWEHEVKDLDSVLNKIKLFSENGDERLIKDSGEVLWLQ